MKIVLTNKEMDTLISEVMQNFPEASNYSALKCTEFNYDKNEYRFLDTETNKSYRIAMPELRKGMTKLLEMFSNGELKGISRYVMPDLLDACSWDADAADALAQAAVFNDVIYG